MTSDQHQTSTEEGKDEAAISGSMRKGSSGSAGTLYSFKGPMSLPEKRLDIIQRATFFQGVERASSWSQPLIQLKTIHRQIFAT